MKYAENLDPKEESEVRATKQSIMEKMKRNGEVEYVDEKIAQRMAVRLHIAEEASDYLQRHGLTQTIISDSGNEIKKKNPVLDEVRRYDASIVEDMRKYGILDDPESKKADSLDAWKEYIG